MHVAADVEHHLGPELHDLLEEPEVATLARRVDDERRPIALPRELLRCALKDELGRAGVEGGVCDVVCAGIVRRVGDRLRVDLDAKDLGAAGDTVSAALACHETNQYQQAVY